MSPNDMTIDLGIRHENTVQIQSRVILSPQHAKTFSKVISGVIENYEKDLGEIHIEPKKKK